MTQNLSIVGNDTSIDYIQASAELVSIASLIGAAYRKAHKNNEIDELNHRLAQVLIDYTYGNK